MMKENITTIVFDLGGVLLDLDKKACVDALTGLGYPNVESLLGDYGQKGVFLELEEGNVSADEFRNQVRLAINNPVSDKDIDSAFFQFLLDIPNYKLSLLLELKGLFRVCMLSNTNVIMMDFIRDKHFRKQGLSIMDYFDHLYLSYEMFCSKPGEEIFKKMIEQDNMIPEQTLFLDDSKANIETAKQLGFKTRHILGDEDFNHLFKVEFGLL